MIPSLTSAQIRKLKAMAQHLEASYKVGKNGLSDSFLASVREALDRAELIKVKFVEFKEQKKDLAPVLAEKTESHLVARIGNVVVLYRENPNPSKRQIGWNAP
jgi:RNA-binding protein